MQRVNDLIIYPYFAMYGELESLPERLPNNDDINQRLIRYYEQKRCAKMSCLFTYCDSGTAVIVV